MDGHACISLNKKINHIMAHGVPILWAEIDGERNETRINGSKAVDDMMRDLKTEFGDRSETRYA